MVFQRSRRPSCIAALGWLLTLAFAAVAAAAPLAETWSTVDGGGGSSTGGPFDVTGTAGQPDAADGLSGDSYSLTGGFWTPGVAPVAAAGSLQLSSATYAAGEGDGFATVTVTRSGGSNGIVSVAYATSDGTAADGFDYAGVSGVLTWGAGDVTPKTFQVPVLDDPVAEGDETVLLGLSGPTGGATLGTPSSATLVVTDDDPVVTAVPTLDLSSLLALALLLAGTGLVALRRVRGSNP
jgi:hypothetical protein